MTKNPHEFVRARTKNGDILFRTRRTAAALGLTVDEKARAVDGHGKPLPDKPKKTLTARTDDKPKEN